MRISAFGCLLLLSSCGLAPSGGIDTQEEAEVGPLVRILSPSPQAFEQFGFALDVDGDRVIIGARGRDETEEDVGAAYVYRRGEVGWELEAVLRSTDQSEADQFGYAVAIEEDVAVVGAPFESEADAREGAVHVFSFTADGWREVQLLHGAESSGYFGSSLEISDDRLIIGAPGPAGPSVHVLERDVTGWSPKAIITPEPPGDRFGSVTAGSGEVLAVGGFQGDTRDGYVSLFGVADSVSGELQRLLAPTPGGEFGQAIDLEGDQLVVGAPSESTVYLFRESTSGWTLQGEVSSPYTAPDRFGSAVDLTGTNLVVGSPSYNRSAGAVSVYSQVGGRWVQIESVRPTVSTADQAFGSVLAADDGWVLIGATGDRTGEVVTGAVYALELPAQEAAP